LDALPVQRHNQGGQQQGAVNPGVFRVCSPFFIGQKRRKQTMTAVEKSIEHFDFNTFHVDALTKVEQIEGILECISQSDAANSDSNIFSAIRGVLTLTEGFTSFLEKKGEEYDQTLKKIKSDTND
jgi:hypothetical protein